MATFVEEKKKQRRLIYALVAVLIITFFVLWQGFFKKSVPTLAPTPPEQEFKKVEIDFTLLENPLLKELQPFSEISPFEGKVGRENPFAPF